ncbi:hypothetical protein B0T21DRAFT_210526 [Apiosordaria backusii]|uniref:Uncharacterized protein n=1 Tax=Apiosordaria backusii TaxID=314023 RepID=A0AA40B7Z1_9PEZI|nr:hypothetical protein B0T21DRAFT_210526 [Apiosordaria backusii]
MPDISCLIQRVEEKPTARPRESIELIPDLFGVVYGYHHEQQQQQHQEKNGKVMTRETRKEMFYMRIGQMSFRQNWVEREVSSSLTLTVCLLILALGVFIGFVAGKWVDLVLFGVGTSAAAAAAVVSPGCVGFGGMNISSASPSWDSLVTGVVGSSSPGEGIHAVVGWEFYHGRNSGTEYCGSWVVA